VITLLASDPVRLSSISYTFDIRAIVRIELLYQIFCFLLRIRQPARPLRTLRAYSKFSFVVFFYEIVPAG
jgi:hypothetical protein